MKIRSIAILLLLSVFATTSFAQKAKLGTAFAQITASAKVTETHTGEDPVIYYTMNTTWKSTSAPESVFFKAAEAWANCIVLKNGKDISPEIIKKGNKVVFKTVSGGRFAIPKEIEGIATPALFFQVKGVWYYLPVKNMKKKTVKE
jgi:hypothetical protein